MSIFPFKNLVVKLTLALCLTAHDLILLEYPSSKSIKRLIFLFLKASFFLSEKSTKFNIFLFFFFFFSKFSAASELDNLSAFKEFNLIG